MNVELKLQLAQSISAGLDFVISQQSTDGSWTDWDLPPGETSVWPTGYIGFALQHFPEQWKKKATTAKVAAANWLLRNQFDDGGWGYNELVGSDADSTAFAVLCLASAGLPVPDSAYHHLERYRCADGGFSTYCSDCNQNSWMVSHADVTPVVLRALLTKHSTRDALVRDGLKYVIAQRTSQGFWHSFWWETQLYSTEANLSLLTGVKAWFDPGITEQFLCELRPSRSFELALLISSLSQIKTPRANAAVVKLVEQLVSQQEPGGSWKADPILRITNRDCFEPWNSMNPGPLFRDSQKLFTSSTALKALSVTYSNMCCAHTS